MAIAYNPTVLVNSLGVCIDAANPKSYPGSGTAWLDMARNVSGTLTNGPTFSSANQGSIVFDGIDDSVSFANFDPNAADITCECAVKTTNSNNQIFFQNYNYFFGTGYGIEIYAGSFYGYTKSGTNSVIVSTSGYSAGVIRVFTLTIASNLQTLYINGNSVGTQTNSASLASLNNLSIGGRSSGGGSSSWLNGNFYYLRIYSRALSATEVMQNFNATRGRFGI